MSPLEKLFQYQDPALTGIALSSTDQSDPTQHCHHCYHQTKAGLYVVLRHDADGRVTKRNLEGKFNITTPLVDGQLRTLPDRFYCERVEWEYFPAKKKAIGKNLTTHPSGLSVIHTLSSKNAIISVQFSSQDRLGEMIWQLNLTKTDKGLETAARAAPRHYFSKGFLMMPIFGWERKKLHYGSTVANILGLVHEYNQANQTSDKEKIRQELTSLHCLIFS